MTSLRMALSELQRLVASRMSRVAVIALVLVPTLYAGLYLYANHDPYAGLDRVPAALVVLDDGATKPDGSEVHAGSDVAKSLLDSDDFDWHRVSASTAGDGVESGRYDFALTIPRDFSSSLTSALAYDPKQARIRLTTNDANSYLSSTIAQTVAGKVRDAIASAVGSEAAEQFLLGFGKVRESLTEAAAGADQLADGVASAQAGAHRLRTGAQDLAKGQASLTKGLRLLVNRTRKLPASARKLADGAAEVAGGNAQLATIGHRASSVSTAVTTRYAEQRRELARELRRLHLSPAERDRIMSAYDALGGPLHRADAVIQDGASQLQQLSAGSTKVADGMATLSATLPALVTGLKQAYDGSRTASQGTTRLRNGAVALDDGLARARDGSAELADQLGTGAKSIPAIDDSLRERLADTLGDPVDVVSSSSHDAGSYGAGLAPFFLALATWIGGYTLFLLVRPLSKRAIAANQSPLRTALGGWYTPALIGFTQVVAALVVVGLAVHIVPRNIPLTVLFLLLVSGTFIALVHALNAWLGTAGQYLGLVLLVLQLVTAGGTFPWQTLPPSMHWLHHLLPMSYAVDGLRQLMYGGASGRVLWDVLVLLLWLAIGLGATTLAARHHRVWTVKRVKPELVV